MNSLRTAEGMEVAGDSGACDRDRLPSNRLSCSKVISAYEWEIDHFTEPFNVCPNETEHRPVYEIGNGHWNIPALKNLLEQLMLLDCYFEDFEVDDNFPSLAEG